MKLIKYFLLICSVPVWAAPFTLQSKNFAAGGEIPIRFTCKGESVSPQLSWTGVPKDTKSFALIVDAPAREGYAYWVVYNLPRAAVALGEGTKTFPPGTQQGFNEGKERMYTGPCPGTEVRFRIFALDNSNHFFVPPVRSDLEKAMSGHILAEAELLGSITKPSDQ